MMLCEGDDWSTLRIRVKPGDNLPHHREQHPANLPSRVYYNFSNNSVSSLAIFSDEFF